MDNQITVTLDNVVGAPDTELAQVKGWVQEGWKRYKEPGWKPTKLMLTLQTVERWADVAEHFPELKPPEVPPIEPPVTPPVTPPSGPTLEYELPWATLNASNGYPSGYLRTQGFNGETILALRFTVPAGYHSTEASRISGAEYGGGPVQRDSCISETPFDFDHSLPNGQNFGDAGIQFWMQVGGASGSRVVLQPGRTYFCNVRNPTMPAGSPCEMSITMMVPPSDG